MPTYQVTIVYNQKTGEHSSSMLTYSPEIKADNMDGARYNALLQLWMDHKDILSVYNITVIETLIMKERPAEPVGDLVLIKLEGGIATFEGCTNPRINVTIIDWDMQEDAPNIIEDHCRPVTTHAKMEAHIEAIRTKVEAIPDL